MEKLKHWTIAAGLLATFALPWRTSDSGAVALDPELPGTIVRTAGPSVAGACAPRFGGIVPIAAARAGAGNPDYGATVRPAPARGTEGQGG